MLHLNVVRDGAENRVIHIQRDEEPLKVPILSRQKFYRNTGHFAWCQHELNALLSGPAFRQVADINRDERNVVSEIFNPSSWKPAQFVHRPNTPMVHLELWIGSDTHRDFFNDQTACIVSGYP